MTDDELQRLREDIKARKQQLPIVIYQGKILDGRNRYNACKQLGIEPRTENYRNGDPVGFVVGANIHRRHLTASQRALIAAKLASLPLGANQHTTKEGLSVERACQLSGASEATANRCKKVLSDGVPKLAEMIEKGQVAASVAEEVAKLPKEKQDEIIRNNLPKDWREAAKEAAQPPAPPDEADDSGSSPEQSDEVDDLVDDLIDKLKEMRAASPDNAAAAVADLVRRLQDADLYTEPKKKSA